MNRELRPWLPAILLALFAAALAGGAVFVLTLPPAEDKSAALTAEIENWTQKAGDLEGQCQAQSQVLEKLRENLEQLERAKEEIEENRAAYDELLSRRDQLPAVIEAVKEKAGLGAFTTYTVPPNYDRRRLTYLQGGNKANTFFSGLLGGSLGTAFGNQTQNMTQGDVGAIHEKITKLNDKLNETIQAAERALATARADGMLVDLVYDPELTGLGVESQIDFWELMYQNRRKEDAGAAMLHDTAWAVKTLECAIPVYATFLSAGTENSDYLKRLNSVLDELRTELERRGVTAESCLTQEELDSLYQQTISWHRGLGLAVQNSAVCLETRTMQTTMLATGRQAGMAVGNHKMLITWHTTDQKVMYATDPKGDILAFYGFTQDGEPLCFSRGDSYVLFDWQAKDGSALSSAYSADQTGLLYRFACLIRDERNGFGRTQYEQYQRVY